MIDSSSPAIECRDLVRIYKTRGTEVQALQGLNLFVEAGEIVAVVGASGSGKSTLLNILCGLDQPSAGYVQVAGSDLQSMKSKERVDYRRHGIGFIQQEASQNLLPYLTASENIALPMALAGSVARGARAARVDELLELLTVAHCGALYPHEMSGGEQQRVAIAVALANSPSVLLADEPTGALDETTSGEVLEALRTVNDQHGVTTLIVTHDPAVSEHVRRTVSIRDGRTSSEVLRSMQVDHLGDLRDTAEEFAVLDRSGRLQLPEEYVRTAGLHSRVKLTVDESHVGVWPDRTAEQRAESARDER